MASIGTIAISYLPLNQRIDQQTLFQALVADPDFAEPSGIDAAMRSL